MNPSRFLLAAAVLLSGTSAACADDWPGLLGPKGQGISMETEWRQDWSAREPEVAWKVQVGVGSSSMAVAGGKLYTMGAHREGKEAVICLDAVTGKEIWRQEYLTRFEQRQQGGGTAVTPVLDGDRVYTLSYLGKLVCWAAADGQKRWEKDLQKDFKGMMPRWGWAGSPLVVGNMLIVEPGGNGSSVAALDKETGALFWQRGSDPASYASPAIFSSPAFRGVVLFNASGLVGINPRDGRELFRQEWRAPYDVNAARPLYHEGRFFLDDGEGGKSGRIDISSGKPKTVWEITEPRVQFRGAVMAGGDIYFVSNDGRLVCVNPDTGAIRWSHDAAGGNGGHVIVAGGKLIAVLNDGAVLLVDPSPERYAELGRCRPFPGSGWVFPAFSEGRLYLRNNGGTLVCVDLRKS